MSDWLPGVPPGTSILPEHFGSRITYIPPGYLIEHLDPATASGMRHTLVGDVSDVLGECDHCNLVLTPEMVLRHRLVIEAFAA